MRVSPTERWLLSASLGGFSSYMMPTVVNFEMSMTISKFSTGSILYLENRLPQSNGRKPDDGLLPQGSGNKLLEFRLTGDPLVPVEDNSEVRDVLRPFDPISQADIDRAYRRSFKFERTDGAWAITDRF